MKLRKLREVLEMIKFEHTVFALPFAFLGAFLASRGFPGWRVSFLILLAMAAARSAAMAFNRLVDQKYDALNPRTASRSLPAGRLEGPFVRGFVVASSALFIFSAFMLNPLSFLLSPLALAVVLLYSFTKRFTALSHVFLGLSLAIAPVGGWVAVRGQLELPPFYLALAVLLWVAGFDIIYACQDVEFDRNVGLHSLPRRLGIQASLRIAAACHIGMMALLLVMFRVFTLSTLTVAGIGLVGAGLAYEHSLVHADDLSRVNLAFFTLNGMISVILFVVVSLDLCLYG